MTARECIKHNIKILKNQEKYQEEIINILLNMDNLCNFPPKQKALLKSDIIMVLDEFYDEIKNNKKIKPFIEAQLNSISPKTREIAKKFTLNHDFN